MQSCNKFLTNFPSILDRSMYSLILKRNKATVIDGKLLSRQILHERVSSSLGRLLKVGVKPRLVVLVVGKVPESQVYVERKKVTAAEFGIDCNVLHVEPDISKTKLLDKIAELNQDASVHGLIVQLPLPKHLPEIEVCNAVAPAKDVDGFSAANLGRLIQGCFSNQYGVFVPCTALAVYEIIKASYPYSTKGLRAVVAGRSHNVGMPIGILLSADEKKGGLDMTTTICHRSTPLDHLAEAVKQADVVVSAAGVPSLIKPNFVKPGAFVIDVGISRITTGSGKPKLVGDVSPEVVDVAGYVTPVPGGVGPCTVACLLCNTVQAAAWQSFKD